MRKKLTSRSAFLSRRVLVTFAFCLLGALLALFGFAIHPGTTALAQGPQQNRTNAGPASSDEEDSPDIPPFARSMITAEDYHRQRDAHIAMLRGTDDLRAARLRPLAVQEIERQETQAREDARNGLIQPAISSTTWTPIGPAPLPNGQTELVPTPVSGRVSAIAVHPTNPDIAYVGTAQGGVYRTLNGGTTWTAIFDNAQSLAIGSIAIASPPFTTTVYVGTGEPNASCDSFFGVGIYRITNAETTAILSGPFNLSGGNDVFTGRSVGRIVVHPTNPDIIFASTTSGVGGLNCEQDGGGAVPPLPGLGLFRSVNATTSCTFTKMTTATATNMVLGNFSHVDVAMDPVNPNRVLVTVNAPISPSGGGTGGGIYVSTDALAPVPTFTRTLQLPSARIELALHSAAGVVNVYAASGENSGRLRRSANGGATWSPVLTAANGFCGGQCVYDIAVAVSPNDANIVLLGGNVTGASTRLIARSITGGTAFTNVNSGVHADNHAITFAPSNPNIVYMGTDGGIYKSTDNGQAWTSMNNTGFNATQFQSIALHPTDPFFTIGGTQDNGTECLGPCGTNPGNTWVRADFGDGGHTVIDQTAVNTTTMTMYHTYFNLSNAKGYGRVLTTADAMDNGWKFFGCGFAGNFNGMVCAGPTLFYAPMSRGPGAPNNPDTLYFGADRLYRSANSGANMNIVSQVFNFAISAVGVGPSNDNARIIGLTNGQVFATTTGISSLTNVTNALMPPRAVGRVVIDPNSPAVGPFTAYATFTGFGVPPGRHIWKTTNLAGGVATWVATGAEIPDVPVNAIVIDPADSSHLYAGTDIGVYTSQDSGVSWTPFGTGLPRVAVFDMALQNANRILRVATHGRGIWEIRPTGPGGATPTPTATPTQSPGIGTPTPPPASPTPTPTPSPTPTTTLGTYPDTTLLLSGNATITPNATPSNTTRIKVSTSTNFKGVLEGTAATGVVRVTDAHPAGVYTVTVTGFSASVVTGTRTFTLTVTTPPPCDPVTEINYTRTNFATGTSPRSVAIGDFDSDGIQDLAVASAPNVVRVLLGKATGGFVDRNPAGFTVGADPRSIAVGDFDGDGRHDLATANFGSTTVSILLNRTNPGAQTLTFLSDTAPTFGVLPRSLAVGYFNSDREQDLAVVNSASGTVCILLGGGQGDFEPLIPFPVGSEPVGVAVGDFDRNGTQDLAVTRRPSNLTPKVSVFLGAGTGFFAAGPDLAVGSGPGSVAVGNFNPTGIQDLATANEQDSVSVLLGTAFPPGSFSPAFTVPGFAPAFPQSVAVGDFDNTGSEDLVVATSRGTFVAGSVSVVVNDGGAVFSPPKNFTVGNSPSSVAVGDFNGDGRQDLAVANFGSNNVSVLLRQCPCATIFSEDFDGVTPPNLPTNWTATNVPSSSTPLWVTSNQSPDTVVGFNNAFVDDPVGVSDKYLVTPSMAGLSSTAQLSFRHNYNLESTYDGGVLEISIFGGLFTDIVTAGGSFVTGGYNATINSSFGSPIAGRRAWSGNSCCYICTVVRLPNTAPFPFRLRFRMASDTNVAGAGWRIDKVQISNGNGAVCCATSPLATILTGISSRALVGTGDNAGIGGFIILGSEPKPVLLRAIGPSLAQFGVPNALGDPVLELNGPEGFVTITNNNWRDTQEAEIQATGIPPTNDLESAILATLAPGAYTAVLTGNGNTSGVALVEVYDLDQAALSTLANISTRAFVGAGDNILIAGLIVDRGVIDRIVLRGIGPSLGAAGVFNALANPTLELRDSNGALLAANNDWQDDPAQAAELTAAGLAPTNNLESGIFARLPPGTYTALLAGLNNGTGIGVVEAYDLDAIEPPITPASVCGDGLVEVDDRGAQ